MQKRNLRPLPYKWNRLRREAMAAILAAAACVSMLRKPAPVLSQMRSGMGSHADDRLAARMRAFLVAVDNDGPEGVLTYFPTRGEFTYVHTAHRRVGDRRGVWRFSADEKEEAITEGPLWASFVIQYEGQPVGLFAHQVMMRGRAEWHRVYGTRYVPPRADASSGIFVEWRREGSEWVVSAFGDEGFGEMPLPWSMNIPYRGP